MKKLFLVLALLILMTHGAFAESCNPNTDKWNLGKWCVTTADTMIPSATAGTQAIIERVTTAFVVGAPRQLLVTESGKTIVDTGGATTLALVAGNAGSKYILPRAAIGLQYTLCTGSRVVVTLDTVDTSDLIETTISGTALAAGDSIKSTGQSGECVTVTSSVANKWTARMSPAVWTANGTN